MQREDQSTNFIKGFEQSNTRSIHSSGPSIFKPFVTGSEI